MKQKRPPGQLSVGNRESKNAVEVWGLTGGIASGKSQAARMFAEAGVPVVDADKISRELSTPGGAAYDAILKRFGTADRAELRSRIFQDALAKRDLEAILHPLIQAESMRQIQSIAENWPGPAPGLRVLYEAALLVETGRYRNFSGLIVIEAERELRKKRLIARDRMDEITAERIIAAQTSDEERRRAASVVIENNGTLDDLRARVIHFIIERGWATA